MRHILAAATVLLSMPAVSATTYTFTGPGYTATADCTAANCPKFTTAMSVSGSMTFSAPLAPNLSDQAVTDTLTGFTVSNGVTAFASADPAVRLSSTGIRVTTDGAGNVQSANFTVSRWVDGTAGPHNAGDSIDWAFVTPTITRGWSRYICVGISAGDRCNSNIADAGSSSAKGNSAAFTPSAPTAASGAVPVPSLSDGALILMAGLLAAMGCMRFRRR